MIVVKELQDSLETAGIEVSMSLDSIDEVACRPDELRLMISQIILNAIEAMPDGGDLTIDTSQKGQALGFTAGDTGTGISPAAASDLFKPLFTTKAAQGVGLGLSLARSVMLRHHHGTIDIDSEIEQGTIVTMQFPAHTSDEIDATEAQVASNGRGEA